MPIYEYRCENCGHEMEAIQKISDAPLVDCPVCQTAGLKKKISPVAFRLKGSGWYETDFKSGQQKNLAGEDRGSGKEAASGNAGEAAASASGDAGKDAKKDGKDAKKDGKRAEKAVGKDRGQASGGAAKTASSTAAPAASSD